MPNLDYYADTLAQATADTLGGRLSAAREAAHLSVDTVANQAGVKRETLLAWESDRAEPRVSRLIRLAHVLCVSPMWLMVGAGEGPDDMDDESLLAMLKLGLSRLEAAHMENNRLLLTLTRQIETLESRLVGRGGGF